MGGAPEPGAGADSYPSNYAVARRTDQPRLDACNLWLEGDIGLSGHSGTGDLPTTATQWKLVDHVVHLLESRRPSTRLFRCWTRAERLKAPATAVNMGWRCAHEAALPEAKVPGARAQKTGSGAGIYRRNWRLARNRFLFNFQFPQVGPDLQPLLWISAKAVSATKRGMLEEGQSCSAGAGCADHYSLPVRSKPSRR